MGRPARSARRTGRSLTSGPGTRPGTRSRPWKPAGRPAARTAPLLAIVWCTALAGFALAGTRLEARADNLSALAFYQRLGYGQTGRVRGYYEGRVDAVKLEKRLS